MTGWADGAGRIESVRVNGRPALTTDPQSALWSKALPVIAENGPLGDPTPGHRTEIRSVWTRDTLYLLFVCPYQELNLRPNPTTTAETNLLWDWDVAEAFIGADPDNITRYKEFQVSPQGEWVDLDIDRKNPLPEGGWRWNSGYRVAARIDHARKMWFGAMAIPYAAIDNRPARTGNELRINFYRLQGPKPNRAMIAWQPTGKRNYHVPESFGRLVLVDRKP
jgi:hypothetical protein